MNERPVKTAVARTGGREAPVSPESPGGQSPVWRIVFLACAAAWLLFFALNPQRFFQVGIQRFHVTVAPGNVQPVWVLDSFALLASNDADTPV